MSMKNKRTYIGFENGDIMCFWLGQHVISDTKFEDEEQSQVIRPIWRTNLGESIRNILLI